MWWERGGRKGLGGYPVTDLPLYGIADLNGARKVIAVEGEPARDALVPVAQELGIAVVATVTGAKTIPSDASLRPLVGLDHIWLWPDNDADGERHMERIGHRLLALGQPADHLQRLAWEAAPPKGDAVEWVAGGGCPEQLAALVANAAACAPSAPPSPRGGGNHRILTADALVAKTFDEPTWAVSGVIAEGANLLIGKPKRGKSWLLLAVAIAIAAGGRALGKIPVAQGDVLLLCLEDSERRVQERLVRVLDGEPPPARLHLATEWPRFDEGGAEALDAWLTAHPETRLVGIDVIARIRPPSKGNANLYEGDYAIVTAVKAVADRHRVAIVAVHHSRKAEADDPLDTISGTNGLAAAADTALILKREQGRADSNLYVRGRDVPERDHALSFDPVTCQWALLGDAAEYRLSEGRAEIVGLLRQRGPLTPKAIAEALRADRGTIRVLLHRMRASGEVIASNGVYTHPYGGVTGVTGETDGTCATAGTPPLPVSPPGDETPPCNTKTHVTMLNLDPVTPVTGATGSARNAAGVSGEAGHDRYTR